MNQMKLNTINLCVNIFRMLCIVGDWKRRRNGIDRTRWMVCFHWLICPRMKEMAANGDESHCFVFWVPYWVWNMEKCFSIRLSIDDGNEIVWMYTERSQYLIGSSTYLPTFACFYCFWTVSLFKVFFLSEENSCDSLAIHGTLNKRSRCTLYIVQHSIV